MESVDDSETLYQQRVEFFKAIESGELTSVQDYLKSVPSEVLPRIISAEDDFGYSPLGNAIKMQNEELVQTLLENGAETSDAMLIAVDVAFYQGIKILHAADKSLVYTGASASKHFRFGTTPLMVACHNDNYDLIEFLLELGANQIDEDSSTFGQDGLQRSLYRLAIYSAICSPSYIMITQNDPLYQAFKLANETHRLSIIDEELSDEFKQLQEQCEKFSEEYLSCVSTDKELNALLSMGSPNVDGEITLERNNMARILYAINTKQKDFVAHRFCQQAIEENFAGKVPWRGQPWYWKMIVAVVAVLVLPFYWIINIVLPPLDRPWIRAFEAPILKFASAFVGYLMLALVVTLNSINTTGWVPSDNEDPSTLEDNFVGPVVVEVCTIYVLFWVLGRAVEFISQVSKLGLSAVWADAWNKYDALTMTMFIAAFFSGLARDRDSESPYSSIEDTPTQVYEICYSLGTLLVLNRTIYWIGVTEKLGKLNILLGFAFGIITKFFLIFFVFQFSFAVAINSLLWKENIQYALRCVSPQNTSAIPNDFLNRTTTVAPLTTAAILNNLTTTAEPQVCPPILQTEGENACYFDIWNSNTKQFTNVLGSIWVTFWALSGSVDYQMINELYAGNYTIAILVALFLWICYCILGVLIFLNILIGLMFKTMESLEGKVDIEYKCQNAQMLIPFIAGGVTPVPPPFNIIPRVSLIFWIVEQVQRIVNRGKKKKGKPEDNKEGRKGVVKQDVLDMLEQVKQRWRRIRDSSGTNECATGANVREMEKHIKKRLAELDSTLRDCHGYIQTCQKK